MKTAIVLFTILSVTSIWAQTPPPSASGQSGGFAATSARGLPASPVNPGLPASPVNPGLPGFNNTIAPFFTNQTGSNLISAELGPLLLNLQNDIQQTLPLIAAFNDTVGSTNFGLGTETLSNTISTATSSISTATSRGSGNGSTLLSQNFSTLASKNVSGLTAVSTGGNPPPAGPSPSQTTAAGQVPTPTGVNNPFGLARGFGPAPSNNVPPIATSAEAARELMILQQEMERMLPVLAAVNGGSLQMPTNSLGGATNRFLSPAGSTLVAPPAGASGRSLTPTGR